MTNWRKYTVVGLVVCLLHLLLVDVGLAANGTKSPNPDLTKHRVSQLGVGVNVKVELAGGKKLKGSIQSVEEGGFLLAANHAGSPTRVAYDEVTKLKQTKVTHNGEEQPDAAKMKRVAERLGVGRHVMVKTAGAKEYHGNIVGLGAESFAILPDRTSQPVQIAYHDVQEMGSSMTRSKGIIIAAVVLGGVLVLALTLGHLGSED